MREEMALVLLDLPPDLKLGIEVAALFEGVTPEESCERRLVMSIGQTAPDVCPRCGGLVEQKRRPPTGAEPKELVCHPEEYDSMLDEHLHTCQGIPPDDESKVRLEEIKKGFQGIRTVSVD